MGKATTKFLAFSCPHVPYLDKYALDRLMKAISEHKPDLIVHLGDGHEASAASRFDEESEHSLQEEFAQHDGFLAKIRKQAKPGTRLVFLLGNHDDNILSWGRIDKRVRGLCNFVEWEHELKSGAWQMPLKRYEFHRSGVYRVGPVCFGHGWKHGVTADEHHAILLADPFGLYVGGHTHKPTPVTQCYKTRLTPLPFWYANTGCLRNMNPEYILRKQSNLWGQGCVVGETVNHPGPFGKNRKREWEAETIVFRMSEDM